MRIVIAGATGFIGQALCRDLYADYELVALSRDVRKAGRILEERARVAEWDGRTTSNWAREVDGAHAVVNLAGESIAEGRWNRFKKDSITQSRVHSARALVEAIKAAKDRPGAMIQASAIGYYGPHPEADVDEDTPAGKGFLADVCRKAEVAAGCSEIYGTRCIALRTGVVLGTGGGALPRLITPFRYHLGGYLGNGKQWFSWISLRDEIRAIRFLIESNQAQGPFNLTAPEAVTMRDFCRFLGETLGRSAWTAVPGPILRLVAGEMAEETLLASQKVLPKRLLEARFKFKDADAKRALATILQGDGHGHRSA